MGLPLSERNTRIYVEMGRTKSKKYVELRSRMRESSHLVDRNIRDTWIVGHEQLNVVGYIEFVIGSAR